MAVPKVLEDSLGRTPLLQAIVSDVFVVGSLKRTAAISGLVAGIFPFGFLPIVTKIILKSVLHRQLLLSAAVDSTVLFFDAIFAECLDLEHRDKGGCTALHHASLKGDADVIQLLLEVRRPTISKSKSHTSRPKINSFSLA